MIIFIIRQTAVLPVLFSIALGSGHWANVEATMEGDEEDPDYEKSESGNMTKIKGK